MGDYRKIIESKKSISFHDILYPVELNVTISQKKKFNLFIKTYIKLKFYLQSYIKSKLDERKLVLPNYKVCHAQSYTLYIHSK